MSGYTPRSEEGKKWDYNGKYATSKYAHAGVCDWCHKHFKRPYAIPLHEGVTPFYEYSPMTLSTGERFGGIIHGICKECDEKEEQACT